MEGGSRGREGREGGRGGREGAVGRGRKYYLNAFAVRDLLLQL